MENKVIVHINQEIIKLITAGAYLESESKSKYVRRIIKNYFNKMKLTEKKNLFDTYKKLSEEQKKRPGSYQV